MTSFFYVASYRQLSATLQTMSINVETYKTIELWFEFLSHFYGFQLTLSRRFLQYALISFYSGSNTFLGEAFSEILGQRTEGESPILGSIFFNCY